MNKILKFFAIVFAIANLPFIDLKTQKNDSSGNLVILDEVVVFPSLSEDEERWDAFIEAVIWRESRGVEDCIGDNGRAVGVLQIHPIMVREANRIIAMKDKSDVEHYTYDDRYDREKSIEIFNVVQGYHNKSKDFDRALQIWNKNHPESYRTQILDKYNELRNYHGKVNA